MGEKSQNSGFLWDQYAHTHKSVAMMFQKHFFNLKKKNFAMGTGMRNDGACAMLEVNTLQHGPF